MGFRVHGVVIAKCEYVTAKYFKQHITMHNPLLFLGVRMYNTCSRRGILNKEPSTKDSALIDRSERIDKIHFRLRLDQVCLDF